MLDFIRNYWLQTLFGLVVAGFSLLFKKTFSRMKKEFSEQKSIKAGVVALLQDRLYQSCTFYIEQGFCSLNDRTPIEGMYKAYASLNGNGVGKQVYSEFLRLPLFPCSTLPHEKEDA